MNIKRHFRLSNVLRKPSVQLSAQASLTLSIAPPDSGFGFVQNSQGASAALSELSGVLSTTLRQLDLDDLDGEQDGSVKSQLRRLETAVGRYSNSSSMSCTALVEWKGSPSVAQLVSVAFSCAAAMYKTAPRSAVVHDAPGTSLPGSQQLAYREPNTPGVVFHERQYNGPSLGGTEKAIGVWTVELGSSSVLIIAVRGTARFVDSLVNLNGRPALLDNFLGVNQLPSMRDNSTAIEGHAGFVGCATSLYLTVQSHLSWAEKENPGMQVVFSGHSAGGAVASVLFAKSLIQAPQSYPSLHLSCITFGAPPVFSNDMTRLLQAEESLANNRGHMLAFVNEFDVVPRTDQAYIRSLIDLYRACYGLDPWMKDAIEVKDTNEDNPYVLPPLDFEDGGKNQKQKGDVWRLPRPEYHVFGDIILLRKDRHADRRLGRMLKAYIVPLEEYQKLLFCGTQTHSRTYYADRIELLRQGSFNGKLSWSW